MNPSKELRDIKVLDSDIQMIHSNELFKAVASELEKKDPQDTDDIIKKYEIYDKVLKG